MISLSLFKLSSSSYQPACSLFLWLATRRAFKAAKRGGRGEATLSDSAGMPEALSRVYVEEGVGLGVATLAVLVGNSDEILPGDFVAGVAEVCVAMWQRWGIRDPLRNE